MHVTIVRVLHNNLVISASCWALMKNRYLISIGCRTVSASGESLAWPVNVVSGVCPARCDDGDLLSTAYIAGNMHGHSCVARSVSASIALAALMDCL
jgi:hypothetical protein